MDVCQHFVRRIEPDVFVNGIDLVLAVSERRQSGQSRHIITAYRDSSDPRSMERLRRYADAIDRVNREMDAEERRPALALVPEDAA